jgi:hypothetical protein
MGEVGGWGLRSVSGGLDCQTVGDRVEVDEGGGPGGLQTCFGAPDVPALAGPVTVSEQAEQPLDPRPGAAQVLGYVWIIERSFRGDQQLLVSRDVDAFVWRSRS